MWLFWIAAALLPLASCSVPRQVVAPGFDTVVSLQGSIPIDTDGNKVHAHGGQLLQQGSTFFWVGTSQKKAPWWTSEEINVYSSGDLAHWRLRGVAFSWRQIRGFPGLLPYGHMDAPPPPYRIERPKILYHPMSRHFILMFHLDTPNFEAPAVGVATAPNITGTGMRGPYTWRHHFFPDNNTSYDMTVYQEGQDAFLVRSCPVMTIAISRLRPDWLATTGTICSKTGHGAEGPAVFQHGGIHYIFASHLTGWEPNPPILHQSTAGGMCSTFWRDLPQPTHGPRADTTFDAQSTAIFTFTFEDGTPLLLWMGDRWNAKGPGSVGNASYVWLPLLPRVGAPGFELVYAEGWSLRQYKGATWDAAARRVRFAGAAAQAATPDTAVS